MIFYFYFFHNKLTSSDLENLHLVCESIWHMINFVPSSLCFCNAIHFHVLKQIDGKFA